MHHYRRSRNASYAVRRNNTWSWLDAQIEFANCTEGATPPPRLDKFASWHSTSALGNALNVWMHLFLYALASGRQLLVGGGVVPELLCGAEGAYSCGIDREPKQFRRKARGVTWENLGSDDEVHASPAAWFSYRNLGSAVMRGVPVEKVDRGLKAKYVSCVEKSLRCPLINQHNGLDRESCVMVRAMQLLLPGTLLRDSFSRAAIVTASDRWRGRVEDLEVVLKHSTAAVEGAQHRRVFFDPPPTRSDASTRFAGAIHIRALPPKLERDGSIASRLVYEKFVDEMNATKNSFWVCAARNALSADAMHRRDMWPRSIFLATDSEGLCRVARDRLTHHNPIACMDVSPAHLSKAQRVEALVQGGLDSHQLTILDWHLLARSRWLVSVGRLSDRCVKGGQRDGSHGVGGPGKSFYGWALAASGLAHPPATIHTNGCPCSIDGRSVSVWYPPGTNR